MEDEKDFLPHEKDCRTLKAFLLMAMCFFCVSLSAQDVALADSIVKYQLPCGGWPKNQDWLRGADQAYMAECRRTGIGGTIDNGATTGELKVLAGVIAACKTQKLAKTYQAAFLHGIQYLLDMQYENGGWPQFWPKRSATSYSNHITFNDNAMVNVMRLLKDVADGKSPYDKVKMPKSLRGACKQAFWWGIQCILDCQIKDADGKLTVWCQQHDEVTLAPASARKYELAAYCGHGETVGILELLMDVESEAGSMKIRIQQAVGCAVAWLETHAIHNMKLESFVNEDGLSDKRFVPAEGAPGIWARYYDLETGEPLYSDRHGLPLKDFNAIGYERRNGYSWLGDSPRRVIERFKAIEPQKN